ncbi:MAG: peptidylprolyl isomerase [Proteobacteria bacterium]|nr:peptidylprolyl isomerase [Pseudomonadota bacterium]
MPGTVALLLALPLCAQDSVKIAKERVILHTTAGDMVLALYPDIAPNHVKQFLKLVKLGVYNTTHFESLVPDFYAQLSGSAGRAYDMTPEQKAAVRPLKAEFSPLQHMRGTLSMARDPRFPDSAETSFSIILADWPPGDGRYTIFGYVESGIEVVDEMMKVPRDSEGKPSVRLEITAEAVNESELKKIQLQPPTPIEIPDNVAVAASKESNHQRLKVVSAGLLLMAALALAAFLCIERYPRALRPLNLANVLVAVFLLIMVLTPMARVNSTLGTCLFVGLLATLKLLSNFEVQPPEPPPAHPAAKPKHA